MEVTYEEETGVPSSSLTSGGAKRLAVLRNHLDSGSSFSSRSLEAVATSAEIAPKFSGGAGTLTVVDNRTGKKYELEISEGGTVKATDFKKIVAGGDGNGLRLFDPGYLNTAPVRSTISFIDGDKGILRYRGYPIEELAEKSSFLEVAYLLMYGNLPTKPQLAEWERAISQHSAVPETVLSVIAALPHDAHPMGMLVGAISALSSCHPDANPALQGQDLYKSKAVRDKQIVRVLGKVPTLAAAAYLRMAGRPPVLPSSQLSYTENFLYMLDSMGDRAYKPNPRLAKVLDILFILHAEHEMNCSTAAARHLASSGVDVYTALAGATGALYGPLHGGANEAVLKMLNEIGSVENIPDFLEGVKSRKRKMSGFGHRVYKNYDPRAKVVRTLADEVFSIVGRDPLIEVAVALEKAALSDEYFVKRKLYPNVDFYSGLIYRAIGFPTEFFPVLFAVPRMAGYLAHWKESLDDPDTKIMRPQQWYQGEWLRHYTPASSRNVSGKLETLANISVSNATRRRLAGARFISLTYRWEHRRQFLLQRPRWPCGSPCIPRPEEERMRPVHCRHSDSQTPGPSILCCVSNYLEHDARMHLLVELYDWQGMFSKCVEAFEKSGLLVVAGLATLQQRPLLHHILWAVQENHQPRHPHLINSCPGHARQRHPPCCFPPSCQTSQLVAVSSETHQQPTLWHSPSPPPWLPSRPPPPPPQAPASQAPSSAPHTGGPPSPNVPARNTLPGGGSCGSHRGGGPRRPHCRCCCSLAPP